jgi:hypothetical protein
MKKSIKKSGKDSADLANERKKVMPAKKEAACSTGKNGRSMLYRTALLTGKTVTGVGIGAIAGMGAVVAAAFAEVTLPAAFVLKAFGLTGGAVGLLHSIKKDI